MDLVNQYQSVKGGRTDLKRHNTNKYDHQAAPSISESMSIIQKPIDEILQLGDTTKQELKKVELIEFDIFAVRKSTMENELVTVITFMMHREKLF